MAAAAKHPRKAIQSHQTTAEQQRAAEDDLFAQMSLKEVLQQLHVTVEDLAALDTSLTQLFEGAPNTDVTEHQQLVQFRSRVARRISRYGQLTKGLAQLVEKVVASNSSQTQEGVPQKDAFSSRQLRELDALLKQHQQRLQKAQTTSGISKTREGPPGGASRGTGARAEPVRAPVTSGEQQSSMAAPSSSQDEAAAAAAGLNDSAKLAQPQAHSQQLLQETKQVMVQEVQRMQATHEQLQQSSGVIAQTEATYNGSKKEVHIAPPRRACISGTLQAANTQSPASDSAGELIWLAFLFFLGCCAFVVLRRLGILRLLIGVAYFSFRNVVAIVLGTTEHLLMGLSWAWGGPAVGQRLPSEVLEHALQAEETLAAHSVSAAPAVSKILATSAALVSAGAGSSGHSGGLPAAIQAQPEDGKRGQAPYESFQMGAADMGGMHADDKRARISGNANGATASTGEAPTRNDGEYLVAHKAHRTADSNATNASKVDAELPTAAQKSRSVASSRGSLHKGSVAARQQ
ncbi:hypothetical protein ACSSS7_005361 [Eimeria intestinalis]